MFATRKISPHFGYKTVAIKASTMPLKTHLASFRFSGNVPHCAELFNNRGHNKFPLDTVTVSITGQERRERVDGQCCLCLVFGHEFICKVQQDIERAH